MWCCTLHSYVQQNYHTARFWRSVGQTSPAGAERHPTDPRSKRSSESYSEDVLKKHLHLLSFSFSVLVWKSQIRSGCASELRSGSRSAFIIILICFYFGSLFSQKLWRMKSESEKHQQRFFSPKHAVILAFSKETAGGVWPSSQCVQSAAEMCFMSLQSWWICLLLMSPAVGTMQVEYDTCR